MKAIRIILTFLLLGFFSQSLSAHVVAGHQDVFSGLLHPWSGFDHWFVALAIAAWSAWQKNKSARWLPLVFIGSIVAGMLIPVVTGSASILQLIAIVAIVLSLMIFNKRINRSVFWLTCFTFVGGVSQGFIHTHELEGSPLGMMFGVGLSSVALVLLGVWLASQFQRFNRQIVWRTMLFMYGLYSLGLSLIG